MRKCYEEHSFVYSMEMDFDCEVTHTIAHNIDLGDDKENTHHSYTLRVGDPVINRRLLSLSEEFYANLAQKNRIRIKSRDYPEPTIHVFTFLKSNYGQKNDIKKFFKSLIKEVNE